MGWPSIRALVQVTDAPLPIQFPTNGLEKQQKDTQVFGQPHPCGRP